MAQERIFTFKGTAGEIHGSNQFGTSDESDESNELDGINKPDESVNPAGGWVQGKGFQIQWQDGPLGRGDERKEPNGASPEDVVTSVIQRMEFYQTSRLSCPENDPGNHETQRSHPVDQPKNPPSGSTKEPRTGNAAGLKAQTRNKTVKIKCPEPQSRPRAQIPFG